MRLFADAPNGLAPRTNAALENVGAAPCSLVEFYTMLPGLNVLRHREWTRGTTLLASEYVVLARIEDPFDGLFC
jgi:hypothetical protein